jgi:hypothetical protein
MSSEYPTTCTWYKDFDRSAMKNEMKHGGAHSAGGIPIEWYSYNCTGVLITGYYILYILIYWSVRALVFNLQYTNTPLYIRNVNTLKF